MTTLRSPHAGAHHRAPEGTAGQRRPREDRRAGLQQEGAEGVEGEAEFAAGRPVRQRGEEFTQDSSRHAGSGVCDAVQVEGRDQQPAQHLIIGSKDFRLTLFCLFSNVLSSHLPLHFIPPDLPARLEGARVISGLLRPEEGLQTQESGNHFGAKEGGMPQAGKPPQEGEILRL